MSKLAIWAQLEAKPGKEKELEAFLKSAQPLAERESGTLTWYAIKMGPENTASSIHSPMKPAAMPTCKAKSPRRSLPRQTNCSQNLQRSRSLKSWRQKNRWRDARIPPRAGFLNSPSLDILHHQFLDQLDHVTLAYSPARPAQSIHLSWIDRTHQSVNQFFMPRHHAGHEVLAFFS